ncbi:MAG: MMPL family transporter [Anaerosomatales bacterium]|nr:MMPL family transporter [Anaerosomatales bacterium]MDT8433830.1 MMPL family transporter [Anaerosomatales bacterium]
MIRVTRFIVDKRRAVLALAGLLFILGVYGVFNARINYDMLSYLPDDLNSVQGFEILNDDFALGNTAQVMVVDASDRDVRRVIERVETIEGIEQVGWIDDFGDLAVPREFWDGDLADRYFSEDATFFQVSFTASANDPLTRLAVEELREVLAEEEHHIAGTQQLELEDVINADRNRFAVAALVLVSVALFLTVPSVIVPVLFVATIGIAVVYNLGMSFYLGQEMSYLTGVIVLALQFAVTMDYALFLYHRYEQERRRADNETAMAAAMAATFRSIMAAALTTTAGFMALATMRLGFGADMGFTLARGVIITVIAVLTILPALLLAFDPLVRRYAHRVHLPDFHRLGGWVARHAGVLTLVFVLAFIPAIWGYSQLELSYDLDGALPDDLPAMVASRKLADEFDRAQSFFVVAADTGRIADLDLLTREVAGVDGVTQVISFTEVVPSLIPGEFVPEEAREGFFKSGHTYVGADVVFGFEDERTERVIEDLREVAQEYPGPSYVTGQSVLFSDLEETSKGDVGRVNLISIVAVAVIIAVAFRSIALPFLLLASIELAILFNQGISAFATGDIIFIATLAIGAIQLGATVDYAVILTTRYEEELGLVRDREAAMREALGGAAPSILVSAATMFAATIGLVFLSSVSIISDLTLLIARGAIISFFSVVILLPPLLVVAQPVLERASIGWPRLPRK